MAAAEVPVALYVVESIYPKLEEPFVRSKPNVLGKGPGSESIYLFVVELDDASIAKLGARVDADGNKQHDRFALPRNEDWWIALEGDKAWPGIHLPKITSRCAYDGGGVPAPRPLDDEELAALRKAGALV